MADRPLPVRLDDTTIARLDRLVKVLSKRAAGALLTRSAVLRLALDRGLDVLEAEYGAAKPPKRKK